MLFEEKDWKPSPLIPCPFCKHVPPYVIGPDGKFGVYCLECSRHGRIVAVQAKFTEEEATRIWNNGLEKTRKENK